MAITTVIVQQYTTVKHFDNLIIYIKFKACFKTALTALPIKKKTKILLLIKLFFYVLVERHMVLR